MRDKITIRRLGPEEAGILSNVAEGVFDNDIDPRQTARFLASDSHEILVALAGDLVVGAATGVVYLHPDKPPQFWINEVGVGDGWRRRGIGARLIHGILALSRRRGCRYAWLAAEQDNKAARALYLRADAAEGGPLVLYEWDDDAEDPGDQP